MKLLSFFSAIVFFLPTVLLAGEGAMMISVSNAKSHASSETLLLPEDCIPSLETENVQRPNSFAVSNEDTPSEDGLVYLGGVRQQLTVQPLLARPSQDAIIFWNGKTDKNGEEILVLSSQEKVISDSGSGAVLSILPLPGKPLSIFRVKSTDFKDLKTLLVKKWDSPVVAGAPTANPGIQGDSYKVFAWYFENADQLKIAVSESVFRLYEGKATVSFDEKTSEIIDEYFKKGFRYFAFEIHEVSDAAPIRREWIAYHFQSTHLYYPMAIGRIGGTGRTMADLIIITPNKLTLPSTNTEFSIKNRENPQGNISVNGGRPVYLEQDETQFLNETITEFTKNWTEIWARNFILSGRVDTFLSDLGMVSSDTPPPTSKPLE